MHLLVVKGHTTCALFGLTVLIDITKRKLWRKPVSKGMRGNPPQGSLGFKTKQLGVMPNQYVTKLS